MSLTLDLTDAPFSAQRSLFFGSLIAVTFAPLALIPLLLPYQNDLPGLGPLLMLTGVGHVGSTIYLFGDRDFRPIMRANWVRFAAVPLGIALAFGLISQSMPAVWTAIFSVFICWQLYHYQRQSYGLVMFASKAAGVKPIGGLSAALNVTVASGALGLLASGTDPGLLALPAWSGVLRLVGAGIYLVALGMLAYAISRRRDVLRSPLVMATIIAAAVFFLPALMPAGHLAVFWSYAIAHGAQYLIFMAAMAWNAPERLPAVGSLTGATIVGGLIILPLIAAVPGWQAAYFGLVCGHFLIDARVWRLRGAARGSPIPQRFAFVFGSPAAR